MKFTAAVLALLAPAASEAALRAGRGSHQQLRRHRARQGETLSELFPFYHSTDDIRSELQRLAKNCTGMSLQSISGGEGDAQRTIDVVTLRKPGASPTNKNFLLFGEHSRELISPESGLHLVKSLCGETSLAQQAQKALEDSEFQIVVNGNPGSRRKVEGGDFCLRTNPNGVDLNRNWDEHWKSEAVLDSTNTNPGKAPFSEFETQTFKSLVQAYRPTTFLTIHSGTKGMYMPWAYDMEHLANRNQPEMMNILTTLDTKHCQCPFGAAGKEVGYSCPGTCLDWVYERLQTQYAFAFEIYVGYGQDEALKQRWQAKMANSPAMLGSASFLQEHSKTHLADEHFKELFAQYPSSFVQVRSADEAEAKNFAGMSPQECFSLFNPDDEDELHGVVDNWSRVYLEMAAMVASNLKKSAGNATAGHAVKVQV